MTLSWKGGGFVRSAVYYRDLTVLSKSYLLVHRIDRGNPCSALDEAMIRLVLEESLG